MSAERHDWLQRGAEPAVEPELAICDPHHHLWKVRGGYLFEEFRADIDSGHNVVATVFVEGGTEHWSEGPEALRPVGETVFVEEQRAASGDRSGIAAGIVGFVDLALGAGVAPVLEAHLERANGRFRGVRHSATWDTDASLRGAASGPGLLLQSAYRDGVKELARRALVLEAWVFHHQLGDVASLARAVPEASIVLNHAGGPLGGGRYAGRRQEVYEVWCRGIDALADCPNVTVKLGGLGMPRCGFDWDKGRVPPSSEALASAFGPYYLRCIERFGPERCMFESNFPVDKISYPYGVLWNAFKRLTGTFSDSERALLFHDTAARVYRL